MATRTISSTIRVRRATATQIASSTAVLALGELIFDTTSKQLRVGDGSTQVRNLPIVSVGVADTSKSCDDINI